VTLCDIRNIFKKFSRDKLCDLILPFPDLLHLSEKGHVVYAKSIFPFIENAIQEVLNQRSDKMKIDEKT